MNHKWGIYIAVFWVSVITNTLQAQKKLLSEKDFAAWKRIENRQISGDGNVLTYELNPLKGDGRLIIHSTTNLKSDTVLRGFDARFTPAFDAVVYKIKVPEDSIRKYKLAKTKKENMPKDSVGIIQLSSGKRMTFAGLKSFAVPEEGANSVVLLVDKKKEQSAKNDSTRKSVSTPKNKLSGSEKNRELFDLLVINPINLTNNVFNRVENYTVSKKGNRLVAFAKLNDSTRTNILLSINIETLKSDTLLKDSVSVKKLTLDENGMQLAFLQSADTAKIKNYALFYCSKSKPVIIADSLTFIKNKFQPSENGELYFSNDAKKLFYGVAPKEPADKQDKILDEEKPKVDVWSYTDSEIQPKQLKNIDKEKKKTYLAVYRIESKKSVLVADSVADEVRLLNRNNGEMALGIDQKPYRRTEVWLDDISADYYLINLKTGEKTKILNDKKNIWISPTGNYSLFFENGSYFLMNNKSLKTINITNNLNINFADELNDIPAPANPYGVLGWSDNDASVFIYDRYDIWKFRISTASSEAINLTNGRNTKTRYRYLRTDNDEVFIPIDKEILLSSVNEGSNKEGLCKMTFDGKTKTETLIQGDFMLSNLMKAKNANVYIWSTQTVKEYPEVRYTNTMFQNQTVFSEANTQQQHFNWLTVEKVSWLSFSGDSLSGLLYKPENFDPNQKYPMLVYFYERNSENIHRHSIPQPSRSIINIPYYCSNGYLVFVPDITYKTGYPGQSAYNAIVSGVYHLLDSRKYINEKKLGLQGQSWGGYQTAFLITQTNLFAAAMAGAPVSNMTSAYGGIRWGTGNSRMFQYEQTQSRIGGTLWDKPLEFIENSPLFLAPKINTPLLIMSNDNDGAVPWYQGIELFMALYRLNKPVWLLNYNGMEHNLEEKYWANRMDLSIRLSGFFDYYLKDKPAPEWLLKGVKATDKGVKYGY